MDSDNGFVHHDGLLLATNDSAVHFVQGNTESLLEDVTPFRKRLLGDIAVACLQLLDDSGPVHTKTQHVDEMKKREPAVHWYFGEEAVLVEL